MAPTRPERAAQGVATLPPQLLEVEYQRRLRGTRQGVAAIGAIILAATAGYRLIEGWSLTDSLYMVFITLSTVGFREVHPLSPAGQYLTIGLILTGVASFAYVAANFSRLVVEGELRKLVGRRRMQKELSRLRDHFIICGFGRVGSQICRNLRAESVPIVVIDVDANALDALPEASVPFIHGDAVDEANLLAAGLPRARGLLLTLSNEADNVYVTLLAKDLHRDILVVARSISEQGERRLYAAGADRVVSPERIGATSMSNSVLRPTVVEFTETVARHNLELQLEEHLIPAGSSLDGRTIQECRIRSEFGLMVVGVVPPEGEMIFNPEPGTPLQAGATLIMLGRREDLVRFAAVT